MALSEKNSKINKIDFIELKKVKKQIEIFYAFKM